MYRLFVILLPAFIICGCGADASTRACQHTAYCYKTVDEPNKRKCDLDREVAESKANAAKESGNLQTPLYEDCWDF